MNAKKVESPSMALATTRQFGSLEVQVYENPAVGHAKPQDDFWMTREQIGQALEYGDPIRNISKIHERNADRLDPLSSVVNLTTEVGNHTQMRQIYVYNLRGVMEICRYSKQPKANAFMDFCWDVMTALMRGETVSLESKRQAEERAAVAKRQANFEVLNSTLRDLGENQQLLYAQYEEVSKYRAEDRQAIENVLSYDKAIIALANGLVDKIEMVLKGIQQLKPSDPNAEPVKFTRYQSPSTMTPWRHDVEMMVKAIAREKDTKTGYVYGTFNTMLKNDYDYSVYEERKVYAKEHGIDDVSSIPLAAVVESNPVFRCIYYNKIAERYEECTGKKMKRMNEVKPATVSFPKVLSPENPGGEPLTTSTIDPAPEVVAEAHAVEVEVPAAAETPVVEAPAVVETPADRAKRITKKKYNYYKPSITLPIIKPIADKLGDKTKGCTTTYQKVYNIIGIKKMNCMRQAYIRAYNKPPKYTPEIFQASEKNMKVFRDAVKTLESII